VSKKTSLLKVEAGVHQIVLL